MEITILIRRGGQEENVEREIWKCLNVRLILPKQTKKAAALSKSIVLRLSIVEVQCKTFIKECSLISNKIIKCT